MRGRSQNFRSENVGQVGSLDLGHIDGTPPVETRDMVHRHLARYEAVLCASTLSEVGGGWSHAIRAATCRTWPGTCARNWRHR